MEKTAFGMDADAVVEKRQRASAALGLENFWTFEAWSVPDEQGVRHKKWEVKNRPNLVTTAGLNHVLDILVKSGTQEATWYAGIVADAPTVAAGDTLSSHAGWTEAATFSAARKSITFGSVTGGSVDNSLTKVTFTATGAVTCAGAFMCSTVSGTSGILYAAATFSADKTLASSELLTVTITCTAASA